MSDHLFLYGTLRPGLAPQHLAGYADRLQRVAVGTIPGRLYDLGCYPAAILDPSAETRIVGEVFKLPADQWVLAAFDAYERYDPSDPEGSLYHRRQTEAMLQDGKSVECWVYVYNRDVGGAKLIESGNYTQRGLR